MSDIEEVLRKYNSIPAALYGLGTETERFLTAYGECISVVGLIDGFKEDGESYGYPIISIRKAIEYGVGMIVVVARPGSCKAIVKRIGEICSENDIALYDVRGRNLLLKNKVSYDFKQLHGSQKRVLLEKIENADVVSFDLFDTLITRKVLSYTDIFELLDFQLKERGICIPDFAQLRLSAEKELSKDKAPKLDEIYNYVLKQVGGSFLSAAELSEMEWKVDFSTMLTREELCTIYRNEVSKGKTVIVITDSYYSKDKIRSILERFGLSGYRQIIVSCEYGISKTQNLYEMILGKFKGKTILHIGDDEISDVKKASENGMDTYRLYRGIDLLDAVGSFGIEDCMTTLSDRLKVGLFVSNMFNSPFWFNDDEKRVSVSSAYQIGYLFCAPIITDFILWLKKRIKAQHFKQILFCARDGYLIGKLFRKVDPDINSIYFLTSRTATIRAGMESVDDIAYVDSMKYSGLPEESIYVRFGIREEELKDREKSEVILEKAKIQRKNYQKYIEKLDIQDESIAMFDFVAKGTTQMYIRRLFGQHLKGFYFLQLEPEFMADKGLDIESFYSDEEKNDSVFFDNYYFLETILTSPYSQIEGFGEGGIPQFVQETRCNKDIRCFEKAQEGICTYFTDYLQLAPEYAREKNRRLDEVFLSLVNRIQIKDEDFLTMVVEDPFFGRRTDIKDVIG